MGQCESSDRMIPLGRGLENWAEGYRWGGDSRNRRRNIAGEGREKGDRREDAGSRRGRRRRNAG